MGACRGDQNMKQLAPEFRHILKELVVLPLALVVSLPHLRVFLPLRLSNRVHKMLDSSTEVLV